MRRDHDFDPSRRAFLRAAVLGGAASWALGACRRDAAPPAASGTATTVPVQDTEAHATPSAAANSHDELHAARVKAFPAPTRGRGGQPLESRIVRGARQFELVCKVVDWEVEPGRVVKAWTYNGVVPGPEIRVREGERVRVIVHNELPEPTAVHWHSLHVPNAMDGVPYVTQPPIRPGETFTYEFEARPFGSHMYHSHYNAAVQVTQGLLGAFIVEPRDRTVDPPYDEEWTLILNDGPLGFTINGKSFPATELYRIRRGKRLRIRFMNEGLLIHPMHLHGLPMRVFARDGYPLPAPFMCDTLNIAPGERWDAIVECNAPGTWAFHCHILSHAEGPQGMFGMVTAIRVE